MRLQIVNDLHLDRPGSGGAPPLAKGVRMLLVAGDTCEGLVNAVRRFRPPEARLLVISRDGAYETA
ncbi:hypothetical protein ACFQX9_37650 [Bradyrhizobium sp. GCM10028915]|uniref:hypothetical protein n=1 Tax=Bradyrhizobium sp. GCM10028915 TaxID=3273385 RepID=UPI00361EA15A